MSNLFEKVAKFNKEIIGIDRKPGEIEDFSEMKFMIGSIKEEKTELLEAYESGDFVKALDATADLIYFATGFFTRMGIGPKTAQKICFAVHDCNMQKQLGTKEERETTHGLDAIKPEGWEGPEDRIMEILSTDDITL